MGNTLHEQDFHVWTMRQADLPRTRKLDCLDIENLAEEIESMGRSEQRELTNRLSELFVHLLKWRFQPSFRGNSWRLTIKAQRMAIRRHMRDNPSPRSYLDQATSDTYGDARIDAARNRPGGTDIP